MGGKLMVGMRWVKTWPIGVVENYSENELIERKEEIG